MGQITIKEIADLCGCGVSTVSRAINNHPDINPETKTKILETIRKYNYIPNNSARNLKRTESQTIAVLVKGIGNPFFGPIIQTLEREIIRKKYSFIIQQVEDYEDEIEVAIHLEKEKRLKGIIFLGGLVRHSEESIRRMEIPFVVCTVDVQLEDGVKKGTAVSVNDEKESYRMVDYLCNAGHRRIAILAAGKQDISISMSRLTGYQKALKDHGISYDENLVVTMNPESQGYTIESGYEMTKELLERKQEFTCLYAISDTLAVGACRAIFDAGLRVPEDVSVAGFDGQEIARYYHPSITTLLQPRERIAKETVKKLFDMMEGRPVNNKDVYEGSLWEGESVRVLKEIDGNEQ